LLTAWLGCRYRGKSTVRDQIVSCPRVLTWMRRSFAAAFALLGAKLAFAER
jgi:threonine/homoserine/homoserine lactone efflux protein